MMLCECSAMSCPASPLACGGAPSLALQRLVCMWLLVVITCLIYHACTSLCAHGYAALGVPACGLGIVQQHRLHRLHFLSCPACPLLAVPDTNCAACPCLPCSCPSTCVYALLLASVLCLLLKQQYYYETIFPRIPKKVEDDIQAGLRSHGLPTKGRGNGGCGGADRRGGDDGNRRPASVKASLSVAFGQRAPNRAGTKDTARYKAAEAAVGAGSRGGSRSRSRSREAPRRGGGATPERYQQRERREYDYDSRDRQHEGDSR
jgi:hypothetical protein